MHATCTTQDIGSWWYFKSRPSPGFVKEFFSRENLAHLCGANTDKITCPNTDKSERLSTSGRFDTPESLC
jgi:hypothetical protein